MDKSLNKIRHERSKRDFPGLKLEDDEFVEFAFSRSKICLLLIQSGLPNHQYNFRLCLASVYLNCRHVM